MRMGTCLVPTLAVAVLASSYIAASPPRRKGKAKVDGFVSRAQTSQDPSPATIPSPEAVAAVSPSPTYKIEPMPIRGMIQPRTRQQDEMIGRAVTAMSKLLPVPPERVQFFNWIDGVDEPFTIVGWHAFIHDAHPIPGGLSISMTVRAKVSGGFRVGTAYVEEYTLTDRGLEFVSGSRHPNTPARDIYKL